MISFFQNLSIQSPSFWLIFIAGILFAWLVYLLIRYLLRISHSVTRTTRKIRKVYSLSAEVRLRNDVQHFAQKQHLASSLFSLDEIAITPKVLIPLIQKAPSIELEPTDSVSLTVPYVPDWPEIAAIFKASTMTLVEALQGDANIILAGHSGSGKTVALAWLASILARNEPGLSKLEGLLPLYVHATKIIEFLSPTDDLNEDLEFSSSNQPGENRAKGRHKAPNPNKSLDILIKVISTYASPLTINRLPAILHSALERQRAIVLIDRMDELSPKQANQVTHFLESLLTAYPRMRIIAALSYDDMAGLPGLGFSLLGMAAWTDDDREDFLKRWSEIWDKWIASHQNQDIRINPHYLNSWLKTDNSLLKPIEYVLKVWAAYSGDSIGTDGPSAIEAYIRRFTNSSSNKRTSLELLAYQLLAEQDFRTDPHDSERVLEEQYKNTSFSNSVQGDEGKGTVNSPTLVKPSHIRALSGMENLIENGFLESHSGTLVGFSHILVRGYLAGNALASFGTLPLIISQPPWSGKTLAMYYCSRTGDVASVINQLIQEDDILHTNHLYIARWLQIAPKNRQWRSVILRTLTSILSKEKDTVSLAAKIIASMAFSGDAGVSLYFRQLLKSDHPSLLQLSALGCGILAEKKAIEDLNNLTQDQSPASVRAGSLALSAIGDKRSLEILASNLLNGSETARRYAAEALANNPIEGYPALRDGSSMEDLLVRRSVAFGLIRINQPWATKIVEKMQLEDNEWVVRNAAIQAFAELQRKASYAPMVPGDPTEIQWLVDYAAKIGTTVAPGKPADELVLKALLNGSEDEKLNALEYLRQNFNSETITDVHKLYINSTGDLRDAAYYVLWLMMISGIKLPLSIKYNI